MSTETTNKKIKIDNGTTFGRTYTDKAIDAKLPTDLIASANKLSLSVGNAPLGNGVNLDGFTYDEATKTLKANGGGGSISVIELTDKNGTIASAQLGEINANPQNFAFKYNGKILLFTSADSTTYQYCNNTTSSSDNNVMTTSTLLTITSSTGAYTIAENVHNVVANSIHPANGGDLTNIQVGSKVYSIPSGGGGGSIPVIEGTESATTTDGAYATYTIPEAQTNCFIFKCDLGIAFVSYNAVFQTYNGYLDAEGDVTDGSLKLNDLIVLSGSGTTIDIFFGNIGGSGGSGLPIVQATLSGTIGEIKTYTIPEKQTSPFILSIDGNYVLTSVSASGDDYYGEYYYQYKYYYISGGDTSILLRENTSFVIGSKIVPLFTDYNILVDKQSNKTEILPCTTADNGKVLSVVNGQAQWATPKNNANTNIPQLPADASTSTYVLKAVNGTVQWVKES